MKHRYRKDLPAGKIFVFMLERFHFQRKPTIFVDQWVLNIIWLGYAAALGVAWQTEIERTQTQTQSQPFKTPPL